MEGPKCPCFLLCLMVIWLVTCPCCRACPRPCTCYLSTEVHCTFRYLTSIPDGFPSHVERVNLGCVWPLAPMSRRHHLVPSLVPHHVVFPMLFLFGKELQENWQFVDGEETAKLFFPVKEKVFLEADATQIVKSRIIEKFLAGCIYVGT